MFIPPKNKKQKKRMNKNACRILKRNVGKAVSHYDMISDGDKILVGLSGGMDSMTLFWVLRERLARIPVNYQLFIVHIDPGFDGKFSRFLERSSNKTRHKIIVEYTDNGHVAHSSKNRQNPCFLCSRLRKKRIFEIAEDLGCTKIALGHNKDDIIETFFLNIFYSGVIRTMVPVQPFFQGKFRIIRPLSFVPKDVIRRFAKKMNFPVYPNSCPSAINSKRHSVRLLLEQLYKGNSKIKGNIFRAMGNVNTEYLL